MKFISIKNLLLIIPLLLPRLCMAADLVELIEVPDLHAVNVAFHHVVYKTVAQYNQRNAFIDACAAGKSATVEKLIQEGADVNQCDGMPLQEALIHGHRECASLLLKKGALVAPSIVRWKNLIHNYIRNWIVQNETDTVLYDYYSGFCATLDHDAVLAARTTPQDSPLFPLLLQSGAQSLYQVLKETVHFYDVEKIKLLFRCVPEFTAQNCSIKRWLKPPVYEALLSNGALVQTELLTNENHKLNLFYGITTPAPVIETLRSVWGDACHDLYRAIIHNNAEDFERALVLTNLPDYSEALALAAGQGRVPFVEKLIEKKPSRTQALKVVRGILKRKEVANRDVYLQIERLVISPNERVPSLVTQILKNPRARAKCITHFCNLPADLRTKIFPLPSQQAPLLVKHHKLAPALKAHSQKKDAYYLSILVAGYNAFTQLSHDNNLTVLFNHLGVTEETIKEFLPIILAYTIQSGNAPLLQALLTHENHGTFCVWQLMEFLKDPQLTPLHKAVMRDDYEETVSLVNGNPHTLLSKDSQCLTPLMTAITLGAKKIQNFLRLQENNLRHCSDLRTFTPLMLSCMLNQDATAEEFWEHGTTTPDQKDLFGKNALYYAKLIGCNQLVSLLTKTPRLSVRDLSFLLKLEFACKNGNWNEAFTCISHGTSIRDLIDESSKNALTYAIDSASLELIENLFQADRIYSFRLPETTIDLALRYAFKMRNRVAVLCLQAHVHQAVPETLLTAVRTNDPTLYTLFCLVVSLHNSFNCCSAAKIALRNNELQCAKVLIGYCISPYFFTLLTECIIDNNVRGMDLVLSVGIENKRNPAHEWQIVVIPNDITEPPIFAAIRRCNLEMVKLLIAYGINYQLRDSQGRTPLKFAQECKKQDIVEFFQILSKPWYYALFGSKS